MITVERTNNFTYIITNDGIDDNKIKIEVGREVNTNVTQIILTVLAKNNAKEEIIEIKENK